MLWNTSARCRTATRAMPEIPRVAASSRLMAYKSAVRRSRAPATRVCWRTLATRLAITSAMVNITLNVTRYCTSETANEKRGGTKKKSKAATFRTAHMTAGPRPKRKPATVTPSR